jgi:hypothetical protein
VGAHMAGRDDDLMVDTESDARYPRWWNGNARFAGWKVTVAVAMLLGVPVTLWLLITLLWPR